MRRISLALGCLVIALACAATPVAAQAPTRDSVTGTASAAIPVDSFSVFINFTFNASSGPLGEDPTGTVTTDAFGVGTVTCLSVEKNRAVMGTTTPVSGGTVNLLIFVVDVNPPFPAQDIIGVVLTDSSPVVCPTPGGHEDITIFTGDISVVDAQPLPTSKEDCKNGGWRTFPQFTNEGQCIKFVNHGP